MSDVQKVSIALTSEQVSHLQAAVESGEYATASEVVREALRDWQWKRDLRSEDLQRLRVQWYQGKTSSKPTPVDFAGVRREAQTRLTKRASKAQ
jgi:antitoxin ParD1/3/4